MRIEQFLGSGAIQPRQVQKAEPVVTSAPKARLDSYISSGKKHDDSSVVKAMAAAQPDVRAERIEQVKSRIKAGFYDSEVFMDELAEKLVESMLK